MFQSALRKSKTPNKYFYVTRSVPKPCGNQLQFTKPAQSHTVSFEEDGNIEPARCFSSAKLSSQQKRESFSSIYSTKSRY